MKVRVLWTGDVIDLCVPRSPFGALECSQGNNLEIRSSTGAEALRDEQWRDEAWVRLNHAGKCSKRKTASTPLSVAHQSFPVTSQVRNCNKHHACFWGIILTYLDALPLRNKYVFLQLRRKLSRYRSHKLLSAPPVDCESHLRSSFTPALVLWMSKSCKWEAMKTMFFIPED